MDEAGFDRLARSLSAAGTRRSAVGRLAALWLTAGATLLVPGSAAGGLRHRRRVRHDHNHDNRKGKRKGEHDRPPRGGFADCSRPGTGGQPCQDPQHRFLSRCCAGVCYAPREDCVGVPGETSVPCGENGDCRGADSACCSGVGACDLGGLCVCALGEPGDPCAVDRDCSDDRCVCGMCQ